MTLVIAAKCDRCSAQEGTPERLPEGWAQVMFKFRRPDNLPAAERRPTYHLCEACSTTLWHVMFDPSAGDPPAAKEPPQDEGAP